MILAVFDLRNSILIFTIELVNNNGGYPKSWPQTLLTIKLTDSQEFQKLCFIDFRASPGKDSR